MKKNKIFSLVSVFALLTSVIIAPGCSDDVLEQETPHIASGDNLYNDASGFEGGLNALYSMARAERSGVDKKKGLVGAYNALAVGCMMGGTDVVTSSYPRDESRFIVGWQDHLNADNTYLTVINDLI